MTATSTPPALTPSDLTITPRDIRFDKAGGDQKAWLGGDPVGTAVFNALSLTFPDGERMFMDAVRHYRPQLSGKLLAEANAFIAQEAIHSREHVSLNAGLDRAHYPVDAIEAELRQRIATNRKRGPIAMLAVTIALEHFTAMMADMFLEGDNLFEKAPENIRRMWQWHALEETEHKAVAYDVFMEATKHLTPRQRYAIRTRVMALVTVMFSANITRFAARLLAADGMNIWAARAKVFWFLFGNPGLFRTSWKAYWDWYRPGFHPWDHDNRATLAKWSDIFAKEPVAA